MKNSQNKKITKIVIGTVLSLATMGAMAQQVANGGTLTNVGEPKSTIYNQKQLRGFANDLPLVTVMKQITPNGWIVKKNDSSDNRLDIKKLVSWQGGKTWVETLEKLAKDYGFNVSLDWEKQVIVLSNVPKEPEVVVATTPSKKGLFVLEGSEEDKKMTDIAVGASEQANPTTPETPPEEASKVAEVKVTEEKQPEVKQPEVKPIPTWTIETNKTLKENVATWAESAGYRLVWTAEDYPIGLGSSMSGEFDSEDGPIKQLSVDYGPDSRAQVPLSFQFFQNKTLVVENWMFEQSARPQYTKKD